MSLREKSYLAYVCNIVQSRNDLKTNTIYKFSLEVQKNTRLNSSSPLALMKCLREL